MDGEDSAKGENPRQLIAEISKITFDGNAFKLHIHWEEKLLGGPHV